MAVFGAAITVLVINDQAAEPDRATVAARPRAEPSDRERPPPPERTTSTLRTTTTLNPAVEVEVPDLEEVEMFDVEMPDVTVASPVTGYTSQVERNFINVCEENRSRDFCRCVFDTVRVQIPFDRFLEIEALAEQSGSLEGTEFADIRDDCDRIFPS